MADAAQPQAASVFQVERDGETAIVTPLVDLRELDYQRIETGAAAILDLLNQSPIKNVVLDFHKTDYYGTTALGFFMKLWRRVRSRNGRMAFCNVSEHEQEILRVTNLDHLWPICATRSAAIQKVKAPIAEQ